MQRWALGLSYFGQAYLGWQSQPSGHTIQDHLEAALHQFTQTPIRTLCAGRTDAGVHAIQQVIHFDTLLHRSANAWVRGTNRYLPADIAIQWAKPVSADFHARASATSRRYTYVVLESAVRPSLETGRASWVFKPLDAKAMIQASQFLIGTHDFSAFRASSCQALSPIKTMTQIEIGKHGAYWTFEFEANAFLHHMIRNIMGCLLMIGQGTKTPQWMHTVLVGRDRTRAAPTASAAGLYFLGPRYDAQWDISENNPAVDWIPQSLKAS